MQENNSSTNTILIVILIIIVVGIGAYWYAHRTPVQSVDQSNNPGLQINLGGTASSTY